LLQRKTIFKWPPFFIAAKEENYLDMFVKDALDDKTQPELSFISFFRCPERADPTINMIGISSMHSFFAKESNFFQHSFRFEA